MSSRAAAVRNAGVTLPQWVWPVLVLALAVLYAVTFDSGLVSARVADSGMYLHELRRSSLGTYTQSEPES